MRRSNGDPASLVLAISGCLSARALVRSVNLRNSARGFRFVPIRKENLSNNLSVGRSLLIYERDTCSFNFVPRTSTYARDGFCRFQQV